MKENCHNCLHAKKNGEVIKCEIHKFTSGKIFDVQKPEASCPSHSDREIEEFRYMREGYLLEEASDVCCNCKKMVGLDYITAENPEIVKVAVSQDGALTIDASGARILCPDCAREIEIYENEQN